MNDIKEAGLKIESFDLHLEASVTRKMAEEIDEIEWVDIY